MEKQQNSFTPLLIIGGVLLAVIIGGILFYRSSATTSTNSSTSLATNTNKAPIPPVTGTVGAVPPNFKGAENSPVVIEEFADFQCPACASLHPTMNEIAGLYGSRIKLIYRNFPLPMHNKAYDAAVAAEAAGLQGKFWDMQNLLFQNQKNWQDSSEHLKIFEGYAQTLGIDIEKFKTDMASSVAKQRVDADLQRGRSIKVSQTPSVYINGRLIPPDNVNVPSMKLIIDAELKNKQAADQSSSKTAPTGNSAEKNAETSK